MKASEHQQRSAQQPDAQQRRGATSLESPQGKQLAQLEAMANDSPQADGLAQLVAAANDSPQATVQRRSFAGIRNSPRTTAQRQQFNGLAGEAAQREEADEPLQPEPVQRQEAPAKPNNTGLPDNLKSGIESLSGISMDNVRVHYNSPQPAQLNAHAYAQGTDIHVAPGQEQHLPHEAWHVVQQAQGRVQPTMQMKKSVPINDDKSLEHEADMMGAKAVSEGVMQGKLTESDRTALQFARLQHFEPTSIYVSDPEPHVAQMNIALTFDGWLETNNHGVTTPDLLNQYYTTTVQPEYTIARENCWKIRFLDDDATRAASRHKTLGEYEDAYTRRYDSATTHQFSKNNSLAAKALNDLIEYTNATLTLIETVTPDIKTRYYVRLAHAVVESIHANPQGATADRANTDPGKILLNKYTTRIAAITTAYTTAIATGQGAPNGIGQFQVKGVTFDVHTGDNNYISANGEQSEMYQSQPITPEKYRNITAAILADDDGMWRTYNHKELAIYLAGTVAEPARYGPAIMTNLIAAGKSATFTEEGHTSIFALLTMTTGSTDPGANPTHASLAGIPGVAHPATTATADREKRLVFGSNPDWMEDAYLRDLTNKRSVVMESLIETQHTYIENFVDNPM